MKKERFSRWRIVSLVLGAAMVFTTTGYGENIDPLDDDSQYAYGENIGWLNFEPTQGPGVTVSSADVTGFVWAENVGWINLSPRSYGGVVNDGSGKLSGYAWSENAGWISFSCENTGVCVTVDYGVTIDTNGDFNGWAWGENIGWVHFRSESPVAYKVQTGWTPLVMGDLDCDYDFTGTDVLVQASYVVDLIDWTDLPPECITSYEEMLATCDWDCSGRIEGADVLIGASIIVDIITEENTPLGQGCP